MSNPHKSVICPHCGCNLVEHGVIVLDGFIMTPTSVGEIWYDEKKRQVDDPFGLLCNHCEGRLKYLAGEEGFVLVGEKDEA